MSGAGYAWWSSSVVSTRIRVVAVIVKVTSRAVVSGSRSARGSPASFLRRGAHAV